MKLVVLGDTEQHDDWEETGEAGQIVVFEIDVPTREDATSMVDMGNLLGLVDSDTVIFLDEEIVWPELLVDEQEVDDQPD